MNTCTEEHKPKYVTFAAIHSAQNEA